MVVILVVVLEQVVAGHIAALLHDARETLIAHLDGVLFSWEITSFYVIKIFAEGSFHLTRQIRIPFDKFRCETLKQPKQIMGYQHLSVTFQPGTDPESGDFKAT